MTEDWAQFRGSASLARRQHAKQHSSMLEAVVACGSELKHVNQCSAAAAAAAVAALLSSGSSPSVVCGSFTFLHAAGPELVGGCGQHGAGAHKPADHVGAHLVVCDCRDAHSGTHQRNGRHHLQHTPVRLLVPSLAAGTHIFRSCKRGLQPAKL